MKAIPYLLLLVLFLFACKKDHHGLDGAIDQFSKRACSGATVTQYDYDGAKLFLFDDSCGAMDGGAAVTDANGNQVCYLGGFDGNMNCMSKRFDSTAKNPVVIYRK